MHSNTEAARALYARTRQEKFALGAFNIDNLETLLAIARAAAAKKSPVLVEVSKDEAKLIGLHNLRCIVDNYKTEFDIEMYINLDHSPSVEDAKAGIDAGFEFIHIDVSQANHDDTEAEIIAATKEVVEYAKKTGAMVESEPHYFGGGSNVFKEAMDYEVVKKTFTKPKEAFKFIETTGIDTFAVAVGNLHGLYPVPKQLDLDLLAAIREEVPGYLSLHGGSGTPDDQFRGAVERGVSKININSEMRRAFRTTLETQLKANPDQFAVIKLMGPVLDAIQAVVEHKMDVFGSAGKTQG
ncbi:MAG: ketose-bisphosphate aldolase [Patescibacteria group bacterium]|nr:ketose-bisphosphate aldolase [Patescibacteria group bacterium]